MTSDWPAEFTPEGDELAVMITADGEQYILVGCDETLQVADEIRDLVAKTLNKHPKTRAGAWVWRFRAVGDMLETESRSIVDYL